MSVFPKPLAWLLLAGFGAYSLWALMQVGYLGIWQGGLANVGATQITIDLIICCGLLLAYVARDCRAAGRVFWPWLLAVLALGSLGVLAYLVWPHARAHDQAADRLA